MAEYNKTVLTNQGLELMRKANAGQARFVITRVAGSSENLATTTLSELKALTTVSNIKQPGVIKNIEDTALDDNTVMALKLTFDNRNLAQAYDLNTIAIYAKEDGKNEILYAVSTAKHAEHFPSFSNKVLFTFEVLLYLVIGQMDYVTVNVSPERVEEKLKTVEQQIADVSSTVRENKTATDEALTTKANASDVYNKQQINDALTARDNSINAKADKSTTYTKTEVDNKVATAKFTKTVNGYTPDSNGNVDLKVGGVNLIRGSDMSSDSVQKYWTVDTSKPNATVDRSGSYISILNADVTQKIAVEPNTTYTFSFFLGYLDSGAKTSSKFFFVEYKDTTFTQTTSIYVDHQFNGNAFPNTWGRSDKKLTFTTQSDCHAIKIYIRQEDPNAHGFGVKDLQLEVGNMATDYAPAIKDIGLDSAAIDAINDKFKFLPEKYADKVEGIIDFDDYSTESKAWIIYAFDGSKNSPTSGTNIGMLKTVKIDNTFGYQEFFSISGYTWRKLIAGNVKCNWLKVATNGDTENLQNQIDELKASQQKEWTGTRAQYDAIANKDTKTIYYITD